MLAVVSVILIVSFFLRVQSIYEICSLSISRQSIFTDSLRKD